MSKKILTVLAPVAALIAFAMVPAMAQATKLQAPAGTTLKVGAPFQAQSTNLVTTSQDTGVQLKCVKSTFHGTVTETGGAHVTASITSNTFDAPDCPTSVAGVSADITTNAGAGAAAWRLQIQQPVAGVVTAHLLPAVAAGSVIQFSKRLQAPQGTTVGLCSFSAPELQLTGVAAGDTYTVSGTDQFTLEAGGTANCGTANKTLLNLAGGLQIESGANGITVDH